MTRPLMSAGRDVSRVVKAAKVPSTSTRALPSASPHHSRTVRGIGLALPDVVELGIDAASLSGGTLVGRAGERDDGECMPHLTGPAPHL
ncbi:hypothetical protein ACIGMX_38745 [Streptomyces aquilus]|uniref:hypothetical protein n=1 Tax=Streptomyces aquilus TaxID=2548456 RepID=UPI0037D52994